MDTISFEADIENGTIQIPEAYKHLHKTHAKVIILMEKNDSPSTNFDPSPFFGVTNQSKHEIDNYVEKSREGWR